MKRELIAQLFQQFQDACSLYNDVECWSARELQEILGYAEWRNFLKVKVLLERGVEPEALPPAEDVKKVQRKLEGDEKKLLDDVKKKKP